MDVYLPCPRLLVSTKPEFIHAVVDLGGYGLLPYDQEIQNDGCVIKYTKTHAHSCK